MPRDKKSGRFINRKLADRRNKAATNSMKLPVDKESKENMAECPVSGRRIVDVSVLRQQMWCPKCNKALGLQSIQKERICGLASVWYIVCPICTASIKVHTSDKYLSKSSSRIRRKRHIVNAKLAAGT